MINQIVKFNVTPEHLEAFRAALIEDRKNAEQEEGYVEMRFFADTAQSNIIFSYECWKDQEALDYHREHPYTVKICKLLDTVLQSPLEVMELGKSGAASDCSVKTVGPKNDAFIQGNLYELF